MWYIPTHVHFNSRGTNLAQPESRDRVVDHADDLQIIIRAHNPTVTVTGKSMILWTWNRNGTVTEERIITLTALQENDARCISISASTMKR